MPKALGFTDKTKGYFHTNLAQKFTSITWGPIPFRPTTGVDRMTVREREEFDPWYNEVSRGTFDFKKEASLYCKNDVDILTQGSLKFRDQFLVQCDMRGVTFGELHYKSEKRYLLLPFGHPVIIYKDFEDPRSYYGFIRALCILLEVFYSPCYSHKSEGDPYKTERSGHSCQHFLSHRLQAKLSSRIERDIR
ncbi:hypothetical protein D4764_0109200 [Takifugu flavidus]|uniref:DNA-directed DNA polymerase n=1 Tax=Takifugu flavidus TaxID=433684 RepID=A0A5C6MK86_9TELE|nr:hypothetical protein D4764_0109200 [Takifugu flavidus]